MDERERHEPGAQGDRSSLIDVFEVDRVARGKILRRPPVGQTIFTVEGARIGDTR
jgi:hypothetical protein